MRAGDLLLVRPDIAHRDLVVALAESAYAAGARYVDVDYRDGRVEAAWLRDGREESLGAVPPWDVPRYRAQLDPTAAVLTLFPETEPDAYDGVPPERVAGHHARKERRLGWLRRRASGGRRRWTGAAWPTPAWAARVYPELAAADAERRLARDLLSFCRLGADDPPGTAGWDHHTEVLARRCAALTELDLRGLELRSPGTALDLRLAPRSRWLGGPRETAYGGRITPNFPTEESFVSPDARGTEGTFRCTTPRVLHGRVVEGIAGEFRSGRLVRLSASSETDRDFLAAYLDSDPNARRLGEVALVDRSSRIGQTGRLYWLTLLDENAAAHIAFGNGFAQTRLPDPEARGRRGVNHSALHVDVMIGSDELEATGITADGRRVPLLAGGEWQVP